MSLDLCADQWLLGCANQESIYAVSYLASDPAVSFMASRAEKCRKHSGSLEKLCDPKIKMVIGYEPIPDSIKIFCKKRNIHLVKLSYPESLGGLITQTLFMTSLLRCSDVGHQWVAELQSLKKPSSVEMKRAIFYMGDGVSPARKTLFYDVLTLSGYNNACGPKKGWCYISLESLVAQEPNVIFFLSSIKSHNIWSWFQKKSVRMRVLPYRLTLCPYPPAILQLVRQIKDHNALSPH